jgi:hypothetical protein
LGVIGFFLFVITEPPSFRTVGLTLIFAPSFFRLKTRMGYFN